MKKLRSMALTMASVILCSLLASCQPGVSPSSVPDTSGTGTTSGSSAASGTQASGTTTGETTQAQTTARVTTKAPAPTTKAPVQKIDYTVNPLKDPVDPAADSGEKGTLYYVSYPSLMNEVGSDTRLQYDMVAFISALQGVLNREKPVIYFYYEGQTDLFWYKYLRRQENFLYGYKQVDIKTLDEFFEIFKDEIEACGLCEWDPDVPATFNVATTVCSATDALPVRSGGEMAKMVAEKTGAKVKVNLKDKFTGTGKIPGTNRNSTGSAKNDAYLWALETYRDKINFKIMAYYLDAEEWGDTNPYPDINGCMVACRDYVIANRGMVFDLSPWDDEAPCDDPSQPLGTDYSTFRELMKAADEECGNDFFTVLGYMPWYRKYCNHLPGRGSHGDVAGEFRSVEIVTNYNGIVDSEGAGMSNGSVYRLVPLNKEFKNTHNKVTEKYDPNKKYVMLYVGDYDGSAAMKVYVPDLWIDPNRGKQTISWSFALNASDKMPMMFNYIYEYRTNKDIIVAASSGVGYVIPTGMVERTHSGLPSAAKAYADFCRPYFERFDVNYIGVINNGGAKPISNEVMDMYNLFTELGAVHNNVERALTVRNNRLYVPSDGDLPQSFALAASPKANGDFILGKTRQNASRDYNIYSFRSIGLSPTQINDLMDYVRSEDPDVVFCDPETYTAMGREAWARKNS